MKKLLHLAMLVCLHTTAMAADKTLIFLFFGLLQMKVWCWVVVHSREKHFFSKILTTNFLTPQPH